MRHVRSSSGLAEATDVIAEIWDEAEKAYPGLQLGKFTMLVNLMCRLVCYRTDRPPINAARALLVMFRELAKTPYPVKRESMEEEQETTRGLDVDLPTTDDRDR